MKKTLPIIFVGMLACLIARGQGRFQFNNVISNPAWIAGDNTWDPSYPIPVGSTTWAIEAYWAPGFFAPTFSLIPTGVIATGDEWVLPGQFYHSAEGIIAAASPGMQITLRVRWWNLATGSTWENASTRLETLYSVNYVTPLDPNPAPTMDGFLAPPVVPEPSAIALTGLGLASLLFLWRRKDK